MRLEIKEGLKENTFINNITKCENLMSNYTRYGFLTLSNVRSCFSDTLNNNNKSGLKKIEEDCKIVEKNLTSFKDEAKTCVTNIINSVSMSKEDNCVQEVCLLIN